MIFNSFWSIPNSVKCAVVRVMARDLGAATTHVAHVGTRTGIDAFTQVEDIHWNHWMHCQSQSHLCPMDLGKNDGNLSNILTSRKSHCWDDSILTIIDGTMVELWLW